MQIGMIALLLACAGLLAVNAVTQPPVLINPRSNAKIGEYFALDFWLPQQPVMFSLNVTFISTGSPVDTTHTINFGPDDLYFAPMPYRRTTSEVFNGLDLWNASFGNYWTVLEGPAPQSLLDGATYTVRVSYLGVGESVAAFADHVGVQFAPTDQTIATPPALYTPYSNFPFGRFFFVGYQLPQYPVPGSVNVTLLSPTDPASPHVIQLLFTQPFNWYINDVQINSGNLRASPSGVLNVVTPGNSLRGGSVYNVTLSYRAAANGLIGSTTRVATFDNTTLVPTLLKPVFGSIIFESFMVNFTLPEDAATGAVKVTFTRTGGPADPGSPHTVILDSTYQSLGNHEIEIWGDYLDLSPGVSGLDAGTAFMQSGSVYTVTFSYQDQFGNPAVSRSVANIQYWETTPPATLSNPQPAAVLNRFFRINYTLPIQAASISLTFDHPILGLDVDLSSIALTPGLHTFELDGDSLSSNPNVALTGPLDSLTDLVFYGFTFSWWDGVIGHGLYEIGPFSVQYLISSQPPSIQQPNDNSILYNTAIVEFELRQQALPGSLTVIFTRTGGTSPDPLAPHVLTIKAAYESTGVHVLRLNAQNFSLSTEVQFVDRRSRLREGATYQVTVRCQDLDANPPAADQRQGISYTQAALPLCQPFCLSCSANNKACLTCMTGYVQNSIGICVLPTQCPSGTYPNLITGNCASCAVANCQLCSTPGICQVCVAGYLVSGPAISNNTCIQCTPPCARCAGVITVCEECSNTTYLYDGRCVSSCPSNYEAVEKRCDPPNPTSGRQYRALRVTMRLDAPNSQILQQWTSNEGLTWITFMSDMAAALRLPRDRLYNRTFTSDARGVTLTFDIVPTSTGNLERTPGDLRANLQTQIADSNSLLKQGQISRFAIDSTRVSVVYQMLTYCEDGTWSVTCKPTEKPLLNQEQWIYVGVAQFFFLLGLCCCFCSRRMATLWQRCICWGTNVDEATIKKLRSQSKSSGGGDLEMGKTGEHSRKNSGVVPPNGSNTNQPGSRKGSKADQTQAAATAAASQQAAASGEKTGTGSSSNLHQRKSTAGTKLAEAGVVSTRPNSGGTIKRMSETKNSSFTEAEEILNDLRRGTMAVEAELKDNFVRDVDASKQARAADAAIARITRGPSIVPVVDDVKSTIMGIAGTFHARPGSLLDENAPKNGSTSGANTTAVTGSPGTHSRKNSQVTIAVNSKGEAAAVPTSVANPDGSGPAPDSTAIAAILAAVTPPPESSSPK